MSAVISDLVDAKVESSVRHDWNRAEVRAIYELPLLELVLQSAAVHRRFHDPSEIQVCKLVSVKTGGCPEDCSSCAQSSRSQTGVESQALLDRETVLGIARQAKANGVSRVCMGAA